jgi:hypothetical protein
MRESPSIVPDALDRDVYLVLDNFGGAFGGLAWTETDVSDTDRATVIHHLLEGKYSSPVCVVLPNRPLSSLWPSLLVQLQRRLRTPLRVNSPYSWRQRSSRIH